MFNRGKNSIDGVVSVLPNEDRTWCLAGAKSLSLLIATHQGAPRTVASAEQFSWPENKLHALRM